MNKKISSVIVCMLMAVSLVNANVNSVNAENNTNQPAQQAEQNETSGKCGTKATYEISNEVLTITGSGDIWNSSFDGWTNFTQVVIGNEITGIGNYVFQNCTRLKSVTLPDTVTSIGYSAFRNTGLTSVTLPGSIETIREYVFKDCTNLASAEIKEGVKSLTSGMFQNCTSLKNVTLPDSVTSIGSYAFDGCTNLANIEIPKKVTSIGIYAFQDCTSLTSVEIPGTLTNIADYMFWKCTGLTSVTIQDGVTSIGSQAFTGCTSLSRIIIPNSVNDIKNGVFKDCTSLESIEIPNSVTTMSNSIFNGCTSLTSVTIPENVTSIGEYVFSGCKNLTELTIPKNVTSIGKSAFKETSLTNVAIPQNVTSIGDEVFSGCKKLTEVTIPNSVTSIGDSAFNNCEKLTEVTIPNGVTSIGNAAFRNTGLTSVTLPNNITNIGAQVFEGCTSLTSATIPNGVTSIGNAAFRNTGLTSLTIPDSVTSIGDEAFKWIPLKNIVIPKSVTKIGNDAFRESSWSTPPTLLVEDGSEAFKYAKDNGYKYVAISLDLSEKTMKAKETSRLNAKVTKSDGTSETVTWSSDNKNVATVDSQGLVTAKTAGTAIITATSSQGAKATCVVKVDPLSLEEANVTLSKDSYTFTGEENKPTVTVKNGNTVLEEGTDYTVTYKNNVNVGQATVVIEGTGAYVGTIEEPFVIHATSLESCNVTLSKDSYGYTGKENKPTVTVKNGNVVLKEGTDYTVTYEYNTNIGSAYVVLEGHGNYTGIIEKEFTIVACDLKDCDVTLSQNTFEYTGKEIQPAVTVKNGDKVLKNGTDYTVTYEYNINVGSAYVILEGHGNYTGIIEKEFTIKGNTSNSNNGNVISDPDDNDIQVDVDKKVDGYGDLSDKTQEAIQESTKEFLEKNYSNEMNALPSGAKIKTDVSIKPLDESQLTQEQKDKIKNALRKGAYVLGYYDVSVLATAYTKDGNVVSSMNNVAITQLDNSIQISITIPDKYLKANRKFGILRLHDGQVAELSSTVKDNVITFNTDCFSIYALTGEDVNGTVNTSDTLSSTLSLIAMGVSAILIIGLFVTRKKKAE